MRYIILIEKVIILKESFSHRVYYDGYGIIIPH